MSASRSDRAPPRAAEATASDGCRDVHRVSYQSGDLDALLATGDANVAAERQRALRGITRWVGAAATMVRSRPRRRSAAPRAGFDGARAASPPRPPVSSSPRDHATPRGRPHPPPLPAPARDLRSLRRSSILLPTPSISPQAATAAALVVLVWTQRTHTLQDSWRPVPGARLAATFGTGSGGASRSSPTLGDSRDAAFPASVERQYYVVREVPDEDLTAARPIPEAADARFPTRVPSPAAAAAAREKERVDAAIVRAASTPVVSDADRTERASRRPIRGRWGAAPGVKARGSWGPAPRLELAALGSAKVSTPWARLAGRDDLIGKDLTGPRKRAAARLGGPAEDAALESLYGDDVAMPDEEPATPAPVDEETESKPERRRRASKKTKRSATDASTVSDDGADLLEELYGDGSGEAKDDSDPDALVDELTAPKKKKKSAEIPEDPDAPVETGGSVTPPEESFDLPVETGGSVTPPEDEGEDADADADAEDDSPLDEAAAAAAVEMKTGARVSSSGGALDEEFAAAEEELEPANEAAEKVLEEDDAKRSEDRAREREEESETDAFEEESEADAVEESEADAVEEPEATEESESDRRRPQSRSIFGGDESDVMSKIAEILRVDEDDEGASRATARSVAEEIKRAIRDEAGGDDAAFAAGMGRRDDDAEHRLAERVAALLRGEGAAARTNSNVAERVDVGDGSGSLSRASPLNVEINVNTNNRGAESASPKEASAASDDGFRASVGGAGGDLKTKLEERLLEALARRDALDEDAPPAKDAAERSARGPEDEAARLDEMLAEAKAKAADAAKHESAAAVTEKDGEYGKFMHRLSDELARWNEREGGDGEPAWAAAAAEQDRERRREASRGLRPQTSNPSRRPKKASSSGKKKASADDDEAWWKSVERDAKEADEDDDFGVEKLRAEARELKRLEKRLTKATRSEPTRIRAEEEEDVLSGSLGDDAFRTFAGPQEDADLDVDFGDFGLDLDLDDAPTRARGKGSSDSNGIDGVIDTAESIGRVWAADRALPADASAAEVARKTEAIGAEEDREERTGAKSRGKAKKGEEKSSLGTLLHKFGF